MGEVDLGQVNVVFPRCDDAGALFTGEGQEFFANFDVAFHLSRTTHRTGFIDPAVLRKLFFLAPVKGYPFQER